MTPGKQHHSAQWFLLESWLLLSSTAEAFVISPTSPGTFYGDFNISPALSAGYASFSITNDTGTPAADLWVSIGNFSGVLGLAPLEDGAFHLGALAAGASGTAFFYLSAPAASALPQGYRVCVHAGPLPSPSLACSDLSFNSVQDTIRAGNSSVDGVILSIEVDPNPPVLGETFSMTVQGRTGTLGAAQVLAFSPASTPDWPADCYELYATELRLQSPNAGTTYDWLYAPPPLSSTVATAYTAVYSFRVLCGPAAAVQVLPATYVSSGNVVKHADVDSLGVVIYPPVPLASATPSSSATATRTDTGTASVTATLTPTYTATVTATQTATSTATVSASATPTSTATVTATPTATMTATPTATLTVTGTATSTATMTATGTATSTLTSTGTATATETATITVTSTATPTATATVTETVTPTASATATPTPTLTASATATASATITVTSTASGTATSSPSATATPSQTSTPTWSPTATVTPTFTASPTPLPPMVRMTLKVYNSAGELVAVLANGLNIPASFSGLGAPAQALVPDLDGAGAALGLRGTDLEMAWDGKSGAGQRVDSGTYTALAEVMDEFGRVTAYSVNFGVLRLPVGLKVSVFNSAGELVFQALKAAPAAADLAEPAFSTDLLLLGEGQPKLEITYQRGPERASWDGRNSQGRQVAAGLYMVEVELSQAGRAPVVVSKQVQVLRALDADPLAAAFAAPNPAGPTDRRMVIFLGGDNPGLEVRAQFFNLAGERLAGGDNRGHAATIEWPLVSVAPGTYFAVLETQGERTQRKVIKMAVKR
jgi:hypothetical protein